DRAWALNSITRAGSGRSHEGLLHGQPTACRSGIAPGQGCARSCGRQEPLRSPLSAGAVAVLAVLDVEMEVIAVVVVVAGAEHGGEVLAAVGAHIIEETALAEGKQAGLAHVDLV